MGWRSNPYAWKRRRTREVRVGEVAVGGSNPIRIQSMTTTPTSDVEATSAQIARLADAGCEIVRVTVPTRSDADALPAIRRALARDGLVVPLVADVHFTPAIAMRVVEHVDKVRVNPGNFADRKRFDVREYTDRQYEDELERIEATFGPLVDRCRDLGVALRIGTNHGSLSDRIVNRYGDTPEGMVESALEFVRVCERRDFRDIVLSMKSSNPTVVLHAYRLLVDRMDDEGMDYPLHLGVTEAGDGEDARIKSAIGIGALLDEGLGDTVRVSLTEDPVAEIPVARALAAPYDARGPEEIGASGSTAHPPETRDPFASRRRRSRQVAVGPVPVGAGSSVAVEVPLRAPADDPAGLRVEIDALIGPRVAEDARPEILSLDLSGPAAIPHVAGLFASLGAVAPDRALSARIPDGRGWTDDDLDRLSRIVHRIHITVDDRPSDVLDAVAARAAAHGRAVLVEAGPGEPGSAVEAATAAVRRIVDRGVVDVLAAASPAIAPSPYAAARLLAAHLDAAGLDVPIVALDRPSHRDADPVLGPATCLGGLLCDGIGDAIHVERETSPASRRLAFDILQAARVRSTRTEFISCPSCGRTLFDLERTTRRIKARTAHLKGVKIGIMGCIVNGPGEMADADFGYVGWGEGRIALFVGREMVARDVPVDEADERLVDLIRERGRWIEPPAEVD